MSLLGRGGNLVGSFNLETYFIQYLKLYLNYLIYTSFFWFQSPSGNLFKNKNSSLLLESEEGYYLAEPGERED